MFADTYDELFEILKLALQRFKNYNLHLQPQKLLIGAKEINIFGYNISHGKIKGDALRLDAISRLPYPTTKRELFKVMGSMGYYRLLTPKYAEISSKLNSMLSLKVKFQLTPEIKEAFDKLKQSVKESISIAIPHEDGVFIVYTDASEDSYGSTLASRNNNDTADIKIIGLGGGSFLPSQRLYNIAVKELLAVSKGLKRFRHYLLGTEFILKVDNSSLFHMLKSPQNFLIDKTGPVSRILLEMQEFYFTPVLVKTDETSHVIADLISRGKYMKVGRITAKDLIMPVEPDLISQIHHFPIILSKRQIWEIIKKAYEKEITHAQVIEKFGKYRGFHNKRTHCEIGSAIIVPSEIEEKILELTHLCSAKRHLWYLKSKEIWIKSIHEKIAKLSMACEKCQKYVIGPIHEKFSTNKVSGDYPFSHLSADFSIIHNFPKGILVFTCANTGFTFAKLSGLKAEEIATTIMTCLLRYGIAGSTMKLDNQFNTKVVKNMAELMQVYLEFSTPRNSRSNTLAELAVKKVQKYIRLISPNFEIEQEVEYAVELSCHLINTEIKKDVELTPLEIIYPHTSFTPFAVDTISYQKHKDIHTYMRYIIERLKGIYNIGRKEDTTNQKEMNQPLECNDYVRIKLENTERANKLSPLYSQHLYRVNKVNPLSNTYVITRIDSENAGIRTKKFLYHRRRLKKVYLPNKRLIQFWNDFPNSSDPLKILREAMEDKIFADDKPTQQQTQKEQMQTKSTEEHTTHPTRNLRPKKPINYQESII